MATFATQNCVMNFAIAALQCSTHLGWVAQLVERQPYKLDVAGSIPVPPTICFLALFARKGEQVANEASISPYIGNVLRGRSSVG